MAEVIKTAFDGTIEEDVQLEYIDGKPPAIETTLAEAENVYKSFLYLRKMYSMFPQVEQTAGAFTGNYADYATISVPKYANRITIKNLDSENLAYIKINGAEYALMPGERETIPFTATTDDKVGDTLKVKGNVSARFTIVQEI